MLRVAPNMCRAEHVVKNVHVCNGSRELTIRIMQRRIHRLSHKNALSGVCTCKTTTWIRGAGGRGGWSPISDQWHRAIFPLLQFQLLRIQQ